MSVQAAISRRALFQRGTKKRVGAADNWQPVEGLAAGNGDVFWAGWADREGVFVVGDDGAIFHFDGETWHRMASAAPVPIHALWGTARYDLWAVGWMGLILRFNGETWQKVRGCVVNEEGKYAGDLENTPLFAITGRAEDQIWAVGDNGLVLHFNGKDWVVEHTGVRNHLRSIVCLPDSRILAAGGEGSVLLRGDDGTWSSVDCTIASNFVSALPLESGDVLLAGGRYFVESNGFRGDLVLFRDGGFEKLFADVAFARFRDLAATRYGILAVGDKGQIHHIRESRIDRVVSPTSHDLLGLVPLPDAEALIVGDFGTVLVGDEAALNALAPPASTRVASARWTAITPLSDRQLWGMWTDPAHDSVYACGEEGTVLFLDRGQWEALPPVGPLGIHALERAPDGGLLAAGQLGEIHHFDGRRWCKQFDLLMDITLLSLWSDGEGCLFAVGDEGLVLNWDSGDWHRMASGTKSALFGLWGFDSAHVLAVGDFGLVLRWNGTRWDTFNAGTEHFLFDVWGRGLDDVYVVGLSGTIGHFDGQRWRITPVRARRDLLTLTGTTDANPTTVAVGAGGIAVSHDGKRWSREETGTTAGLRAITVQKDGTFYAAGDGGTILRRDPG